MGVLLIDDLIILDNLTTKAPLLPNSSPAPDVEGVALVWDVSCPWARDASSIHVLLEDELE